MVQLPVTLRYKCILLGYVMFILGHRKTVSCRVDRPSSDYKEKAQRLAGYIGQRNSRDS